MNKRESGTTIELAARALRDIVLDSEPGELIGSEDALIARLGCSRSTVRQIARLLEREGLLKVRRGIKGGYFGARPDASTIEATVSSYLEAIHVDSHDVTVVASALWVEAMRKAAAADHGEALAMTQRLIPKLKALKDNATFEKVLELELLVQGEIFALSRAAYIKLVFDINVAFSRRRFISTISDERIDEHVRFVRAWRDAKLLELSAIAEGDGELAAMAGQHSRKIWHRRITSRFAT